MIAPRYLFGPVLSRRYGQSLGVDLAVPKTCSLNCRFCQLGPTPAVTVTRTEMPLMPEVLAELRTWLETHPPVDFITAGGSGEPTLHRHFGDLFRFVRDKTSCRTLLLSNGSLFTLPEVRRDAACAHVVKLSLHAWDQNSFSQIVCPHPSLNFEEILSGYRTFRNEFSGRLDLEVFIIPGYNDQPEQVQRIAVLARDFSPDSITLNTVVRPPADADVTACPPEQLRELAACFTPAACISGAEPMTTPALLTAEALIAMVSRHPVSLDALGAAHAASGHEIQRVLAKLAQQKKITFFDRNGQTFAGPVCLEDQQTGDSTAEQ